MLVLTAHFGNWELLTIIGHMIGYPISMVYRPLDMKPLDRFFVKLRTRFGGKVIPSKRALRKYLQVRPKSKEKTLFLIQPSDIKQIFSNLLIPIFYKKNYNSQNREKISPAIFPREKLLNPAVKFCL